MTEVANPRPRCLVFVGRFPTPVGWVDVAIAVAPSIWLGYVPSEELERRVCSALPRVLDLQERTGVPLRTGWVRDLRLDDHHRVTLNFWPSENGSTVPIGTLH